MQHFGCRGAHTLAVREEPVLLHCCCMMLLPLRPQAHCRLFITFIHEYLFPLEIICIASMAVTVNTGQITHKKENPLSNDAAPQINDSTCPATASASANKLSGTVKLCMKWPVLRDRHPPAIRSAGWH